MEIPFAHHDPARPTGRRRATSLPPCRWRQKAHHWRRLTQSIVDPPGPGKPGASHTELQKENDVTLHQRPKTADRHNSNGDITGDKEQDCSPRLPRLMTLIVFGTVCFGHSPPKTTIYYGKPPAVCNVLLTKIQPLSRVNMRAAGAVRTPRLGAASDPDHQAASPGWPHRRRSDLYRSARFSTALRRRC